MYNSNNNSKRYLFYLYLLSFIIDLPSKYKEIVSNLTYDDLKYEETEKNGKHQNYIINLVMGGKLPYAFTKKNNIIYFDDYADRVMLKEATASYMKYKEALETLIKDSKYTDAISLLRNENSVRNLSVYNTYLLYLMEDILKIQDTGEVNEVIVTEHTVNMFNAINNNNYELALELCNVHNEKINVNNEDNMMYILLSRIVELKKQYITEDVKDSIEEDKEIINEKELIPFSDIVNSLINNDVNFYNVLYDYLNENNLLSYYDFINKLIEIANINGNDYTEVLTIMTRIANESYIFDENYYIKLFYECIGSNQYNKAQLYLDILEMFGYVNYLLIQELRKVIDVLIVKDQEVKNTIQCDVVVKEKDEYVRTENDYKSSIVTKPVFESKKVQRKEYVPMTDDEEKFIKEKIELLSQNRGIIILKPMDSDRRKNIHHIVEKIREVNSFSIGNGNNRRVVLRHNGCKYVDIKEVIKEADRLFYARRYNEALELYLDILGTNSPKTFTFAKIGLTYLKMKDIENAIMYLTVATELAKIKGEDFDFSDLIASLDGSIPEEEKKPKFRMYEEEFINDLNDYYGVDKFDEMYSYVVEMDMSVEEACEALEFTNEEYQLSLLLIARNHYANAMYGAGDNYIKKLEKLDHKTKKVLLKMEEVRRNKKFYVYRNDGVQKIIKSSN